jgi:hypothetical protein
MTIGTTAGLPPKLVMGSVLKIKCMTTSASIVTTAGDLPIAASTVPGSGAEIVTWTGSDPASNVDGHVYSTGTGNILLTRPADWTAATTANALPNAGIAKSAYDPTSVAAGGLACHGSWL